VGTSPDASAPDDTTPDDTEAGETALGAAVASIGSVTRSVGSVATSLVVLSPHPAATSIKSAVHERDMSATLREHLGAPGAA
jgi:hypothetical protein